jgi:predicted glycogen debranching enzyme
VSPPPGIRFGREICENLDAAQGREWPITNGTGSYGSGAVAGWLTRAYHGLLVAVLRPPVGRTVLARVLDDTVTYGGDDYHLATQRWKRGAVAPAGDKNVERFHLDGTVPVWRYAFADALVERAIWLEPYADTAYVCFTVRRASAPARQGAGDVPRLSRPRPRW